MRAGLFGGTFNPIHNGHLAVAAAVLGRLALDRIYFIPCRVPPHKAPTYLAPAADRLRMLQLALPPKGPYAVSRAEIDREGPSYTIDTVAHFRRTQSTAAALFLVMGLDAFFEFHTWKRCEALLDQVQPVVVSRPWDGDGSTPDEVAALDAYIRGRLAADFRYDAPTDGWQSPGGRRIHRVAMAPLAVSSSQVRQRLDAGRTIADLVPAAVQAYIDAKELYR